MATSLGFHGSSQQLLVASVSRLSQQSFTARVASCYGRARRPLLIAGLGGYSNLGPVVEKPSTSVLEIATCYIPGAFGRIISVPRPPLSPHSNLYSALRYSSMSRDVEIGEDIKEDSGMENKDWKIKMLYDGECPLCMREVNMLRERNEKYGAIKFVDICADDYSAEQNGGIGYEEAMGRIHAIRDNGEVLTNIAAFRALYEEVGLGWVYAITKYEPWASIIDKVYDYWAKYRLPITGRPPLAAVLEKRRQMKMASGKRSADERCRVD